MQYDTEAFMLFHIYNAKTLSKDYIDDDMATAYKIHIDPNHVGLLGYKHDEDTAFKLSELLQKDLENHHVFWQTKGWHNHVAHHLLTIYGTGGSPEALQAAFDNDAPVQIKVLKPHDGVFEELQQDWAVALKYLGKDEYYPDFLRYFQWEVERKGWRDVLLQYIFSGEDGSYDMFSRSWSSFAHSLIQLMYGIEWEQPAIIAEGLAQAAIHGTYIGDFLTKIEKVAAAKPRSGLLTCPELLERVQSDKVFVNSVRYKDPNEILDGLEILCPDEGIEYLAQVKVEPEDLEERAVENLHTAAYMASASVFHPPDNHRFDFFLIHHLTSAPLLVLINQAAWIPAKAKLRVLEWKIRFDILHYVHRWCPPLRIDLVAKYSPKDAVAVGSTEELLPRFHELPDDGHVVKTARALLIAQIATQKYSDRPWIRITDDDMWLRTVYLLLDSTEEDPRFPWVRSAGWDEAWKEHGIPLKVL